MYLTRLRFQFTRALSLSKTAIDAPSPGYPAKEWGKEKATMPWLQKNQLHATEKASISNHPGLPCQGMGQTVSMPPNISPVLAISSLPLREIRNSSSCTFEEGCWFG